MLWTSFVTATQDAIIGRASNALNDVADPFVWDEGSAVNIQLLDTNDVLSSDTEANVLDGANMGVLGDEIVQWQYATLESNGSYTLSRLLRGRKGSDYATGDHAAGDVFVMLNLDKMVFVTMDVEDKDQRVQFRATSVGMPVSSFTLTEKNVRLRNLQPLSVQHVSGSRDGSGNLTVGWIRRTRFGGEWQDGGDVPLGESSEEYEVDVYDGSVIVRTTTGLTSSTWTYTAAMQNTDFGSLQSSVTVKIYQISTALFGTSIGRGFEAEATV
jgi:hypothetical protein